MDRNAEPAAIVRGLGETLARVEAAARSVSAEQLQRAPAPGAWSANEILTHIRATADVYGEHIARILGEDQPRWRHVSPRARMRKVRYNELPFAESLAAFAAQRTALVALLAPLPPEAWQRVALVKVDYKPNEDWRLSLHERVGGMVEHEHGHCRQLEELTAEGHAP